MAAGDESSKEGYSLFSLWEQHLAAITVAASLFGHANALSAGLSRAILLCEANFQVALQAAADFRRDLLRIAAEFDLGEAGMPLGDGQRRYRNPPKLRKPARSFPVIGLPVAAFGMAHSASQDTVSAQVAIDGGRRPATGRNGLDHRGRPGGRVSAGKTPRTSVCWVAASTAINPA